MSTNVDACPVEFSPDDDGPRLGASATTVQFMSLPVLALAAVLIYFLLHRLLFWRAVRLGSRTAQVAASALRALREADPSRHPATRHIWTTGLEYDVSSPLLCVACSGHVDPVASAHSLRYCAACGVVAHDGCLRHVGHTCRPLSIPSEHPRHYWLVCGTSIEENPEIIAEQGANGLTATRCLYCGDDASGDISVSEPAWKCACCPAKVHVGCYSAAYPELSSIAAAIAEYKAAHAKLEGGNGVGLQPVRSWRRHRRAPSGSLPSGEKLKRVEICAPTGVLQRVVLHANCVKYAKESSRRSRDSEAVEINEEEDAAQRETDAAAAAQKDHEGGSPPAGNSPRAGDGLLSRTASITLPRKATGDQTAQHQISSSAARKQSWWRRAFARRPLRWHEWELMAMPPNCRPVLVFVNVRSGPQVGDMLRRRFLRVLHPLQLVTLPRDPPEPALKLFANVPGLRVLCVGGDGTAGWILSCLDKLVESKKGDLYEDKDGCSIDEVWVPPPVGIMPLGTGNDLARCLGWGGGYRTWRHVGVVGMLSEVTNASVALLDRWTITFRESASLPASRDDNNNNDALVSAGKKLLLSPRTVAVKALARAGGAFADITSQGQGRASTKTMNNYLGIGVDAKVALEFHEMRDAYPHWFQSQFGNRLMYTGFGALDIVGGGPLNLPNKVTLECDGVLVPLPPGAEGILIVNIPSYMGGVDLWSSGARANGNVSAGEAMDWENDSIQAVSGSTNVSALPTGKQSICDGLFEIVAVFGSWHLGQLTVGLSRAVRLRQGRKLLIRTSESLPMQVDGEPFMQSAGEVLVEHRGHARILRRVENKPVAAVVRVVEEVLEDAASSGVISQQQHNTLSTQLAARLHSS